MPARAACAGARGLWCRSTGFALSGWPKRGLSGRDLDQGDRAGQDGQACCSFMASMKARLVGQIQPPLTPPPAVRAGIGVPAFIDPHVAFDLRGGARLAISIPHMGLSAVGAFRDWSVTHKGDTR
jgi:hypothetical protein